MYIKNKKNEMSNKKKFGLIIHYYSFSKNFKYNIIKYANIKFIILVIFFYVLFYKKNYSTYESPSHIHIAMSLNNNYTYPIMVSITSILLNSNKNTSIQFHI